MKLRVKKEHQDKEKYFKLVEMGGNIQLKDDDNFVICHLSVNKNDKIELNLWNDLPSDVYQTSSVEYNIKTRSSFDEYIN